MGDCLCSCPAMHSLCGRAVCFPFKGAKNYNLSSFSMRPRQEGEVRFCQLFRVRWEVHGFVFSGYLLACWSCLEEFVTPFLPGKLLASCETNVLPPKPARKAVSPSSKCSEPIPLTQAAFHASGMCFWIGISCHAVVGGDTICAALSSVTAQARVVCVKVVCKVLIFSVFWKCHHRLIF